MTYYWQWLLLHPDLFCHFCLVHFSKNLHCFFSQHYSKSCFLLFQFSRLLHLIVSTPKTNLVSYNKAANKLSLPPYSSFMLDSAFPITSFLLASLPTSPGIPTLTAVISPSSCLSPPPLFSSMVVLFQKKF